MSSPTLVTGIEEIRKAVAKARRAGLSVSLVPTMGALHAGHISLIRAARAETGFVIVSIFVNPIQFGPQEDLSRYPRPLEQDLAICARERVDRVFHPDVAVMYPPGFRTFVEVQGLQDVLCGKSRPGHFRGVATVVLKLFHIVQPDVAYFGQKDGQQARLIEQMVRDLNVPVRLRVCPIVREPDGLAHSSRNQYLDPNQRPQATVLYRALEEARRLIDNGERDGAVVQQALAARVQQTPGAALDYAAVVDADTLEAIARLQGEVLLAVAVKFGGTRLIDNCKVQVPGS
jgi:pantoate--beta-alanine ligase